MYAYDKLQGDFISLTKLSLHKNLFLNKKYPFTKNLQKVFKTLTRFIKN